MQFIVVLGEQLDNLRPNRDKQVNIFYLCFSLKRILIDTKKPVYFVLVLVAADVLREKNGGSRKTFYINFLEHFSQ